MNMVLFQIFLDRILCRLSFILFECYIKYFILLFLFFKVQLEFLFFYLKWYQINKEYLFFFKVDIFRFVWINIQRKGEIEKGKLIFQFDNYFLKRRQIDGGILYLRFYKIFYLLIELVYNYLESSIEY